MNKTIGYIFCFVIIVAYCAGINAACANKKVQELDAYARETWTQGVAWAESLELTPEERAQLETIKTRIITMYYMARDLFGDESLLVDILKEALIRVFNEKTTEDLR